MECAIKSAGRLVSAPIPQIINNQKLIKMQTKKFKIKDDDNVMIESFQSITEFREIIKSRKEGDLWKGYARSDEDSDSMRVFSLTTCFGEADKLLADGYTEGVEMLKREIAKLPVQQATKKRIVYRPQGSSPSVGRYISGNPNCMRKSINKPRKTNVIKIYFSSSYDARVSTEKATQYGAELLNLIHSIENSGYRVELICTVLNDNSKGKVACATMPVKKPMETLNLAKVGYPIMHPSWLRRHLFRWLETCSFCNNNAHVRCHGYCIPFYFPKTKAILHQIMGANDLFVDYYMYEQAKKDGRDLLTVMQNYAKKVFAS